MPPPTEPDGHDLQRQIARLHEDLQKAIDRAENHVTETGLAALLGRIDDQVKGLGEDIAQERGFRQADIQAERDSRKDAVSDLRESLQRMTTTQRFVAVSVLLPVALFIANLVFLFARS